MPIPARIANLYNLAQFASANREMVRDSKMTGRFSRILIGFSVLAIAGTARAQTPPPMPPGFPPPPDMTSAHNNSNQEYDMRMGMDIDKNSRATVAAAGVARCVVQKAGSRAGELVGGGMTADVGFQRLNRALKGKYSACTTKHAVGVPIMLVNGAIAEELVRQARPRLSDRARLAEASAGRAFHTDPTGTVSVESVSRCLAVHSPGLVYRVLATTPLSTDEKSAFGTLFAQTPECGLSQPPQNIPQDLQRSALGAALYLWLNRA